LSIATMRKEVIQLRTSKLFVAINLPKLFRKLWCACSARTGVRKWGSANVLPTKGRDHFFGGLMDRPYDDAHWSNWRDNFNCGRYCKLEILS